MCRHHVRVGDLNSALPFSVDTLIKCRHHVRVGIQKCSALPECHNLPC
ncbi:hypothetical protein SLEP1_g6521 [Rubroshorea leprosula]|uniref:Uncharacterized protein n=1 Tax=Rubroshorea leprosula TaxID=152421 RepID=A0AAV5I5A2_9ROSI|nr:hypothetical protein SLEP1_g6521 [Rubroshorea leprosula]